MNKVETFVKKNSLTWLSNAKLTRKLFSIESNYVENNPDKVILYTGQPLKENELKILTNDKANSTGRSKWYVIDTNEIKTGREYIDKYIVACSSVVPTGQSMLSSMLIFKPKEVFGRCKLGMNTFNTLQEAENFTRYIQSDIIVFLSVMTPAALSSTYKCVPDILNYSSNSMLDWNQNIDLQLKDLIGLTDAEITYIEQYVHEKVKK